MDNYRNTESFKSRPELKKVLASRLGKLIEKKIDVNKGDQRQTLADQIHYSKSMINKWCSEKSEEFPSLNALLRLKKVLGCSIDYLLDEDVSAPDPVVASVCDQTGLSAEAVEKLKFYKEYHAAYEAAEDRIKKERYPDSMDEEPSNQTLLRILYPDLDEEDYIVPESNTYFETIVSKIIVNETLINLIINYDGMLSETDDVIRDGFARRLEWWDKLTDRAFDMYETDEEYESSVEVRGYNEAIERQNLYQQSLRSGLKLALADEVVNIIENLMPRSLYRKQMKRLEEKQIAIWSHDYRKTQNDDQTRE